MKATTTTLVFAIAVTVTVTIMLIMKDNSHQGPRLEDDQLAGAAALRQPKRVSRFLAANEPKPRNPNAADHCHKDGSVCQLAMPLVGRNATCCNNKCVDLQYDSQHCGACKKNKCLPFEMCCQGECVNLSYDARHCGECNNVCRAGPKSDPVCIYAMCGYA